MYIYIYIYNEAQKVPPGRSALSVSPCCADPSGTPLKSEAYKCIHIYIYIYIYMQDTHGPLQGPQGDKHQGHLGQRLLLCLPDVSAADLEPKWRARFSSCQGGLHPTLRRSEATRLEMIRGPPNPPCWGSFSPRRAHPRARM